MPETLVSLRNNSENGALPKDAIKNVMEVLEKKKMSLNTEK